jgi:hypothetical protein
MTIGLAFSWSKMAFLCYLFITYKYIYKAQFVKNKRFGGL